MDAFVLIQNFFTRMPCQHCGTHFHAEDVSLEGEGDGYYVVSLNCHHCGEHNGTAAVGIEAGEHLEELMNMPPEAITEIFAQAAGHTAQRVKRQRMRRFKDPEITNADRIRLADFEPINDDDVLNAHQFIQNLDRDWMKFIPKEIHPRKKSTEPESPTPQ